MCSPASFHTAMQHALALVVAGAVLVRLAEVAERDRAVDGRHDLRQPDVLRVAGEHVAAADAALGAHQPGALEGEQDLLEVRLRQAGALGDVAHRRRAVGVGVEGERQQRPAGVVAPGRDAHRAIVRVACLPPWPVHGGAVRLDLGRRRCWTLRR